MNLKKQISKHSKNIDNEHYNQLRQQFEQIKEDNNLHSMLKMGHPCDDYIEKLKKSNIDGTFGMVYDVLDDYVYDNKNLILTFNQRKKSIEDQIEKKSRLKYKKMIKYNNKRLRKKLNVVYMNNIDKIKEALRLISEEEGIDYTKKEINESAYDEKLKEEFFKITSSYIVRNYYDKTYNIKNYEWLGIKADEGRLSNNFSLLSEKTIKSRKYSKERKNNIINRLNEAYKTRNISNLSLRVLTKANIILHVGGLRNLKTNEISNREYTYTNYARPSLIKIIDEEILEEIEPIKKYIKEHHLYGIENPVDINKKYSNRYVTTKKHEEVIETHPLYRKLKKYTLENQRKGQYIDGKFCYITKKDKGYNKKFMIEDVNDGTIKTAKKEIKKIKKTTVKNVKDKGNYEKNYKLMKEYNNMLKNTDIKYNKSYEDVIKDKSTIEDINTDNFKHFTKNYVIKDKKIHGVRCYSKLQQIKSQDRLLIDINGEETIDIDYSSIHAYILYTIEGITPFKDMYDIDEVVEIEELINGDNNIDYNPNFKNRIKKDVSRSIIKRSFQIMLNTKDEKTAINAISNIKGVNKIEAHEIYHTIKIKNYRIKDYFHNKDMWIKLQNLESQMTQYTIDKSINHNIVVINIHDSFLTGKSNEKLIKRFMIEAFQHVLKTDMTPQLKVENRYDYNEDEDVNTDIDELKTENWIKSVEKMCKENKENNIKNETSKRNEKLNKSLENVMFA